MSARSEIWRSCILWPVSARKSSALRSDAKTGHTQRSITLRLSAARLRARKIESHFLLTDYDDLCYTSLMDIEMAIRTLEEAVQRANGHAYTHPLKTRDVELALRVLERLAAPLRSRQASFTAAIAHRPPRHYWVEEKYE